MRGAGYGYRNDDDGDRIVGGVETGVGISIL